MRIIERDNDTGVYEVKYSEGQWSLPLIVETIARC